MAREGGKILVDPRKWITLPLDKQKLQDGFSSRVNKMELRAYICAIERPLISDMGGCLFLLSTCVMRKAECCATLLYPGSLRELFNQPFYYVLHRYQLSDRGNSVNRRFDAIQLCCGFFCQIAQLVNDPQ